jgi:hypothetical protein
MFRASTGHHQEAMCMYVANGISMMEFHPGRLTVFLEVSFAIDIHLPS